MLSTKLWRTLCSLNHARMYIEQYEYVIALCDLIKLFLTSIAAPRRESNLVVGLRSSFAEFQQS